MKKKLGERENTHIAQKRLICFSSILGTSQCCIINKHADLLLFIFLNIFLNVFSTTVCMSLSTFCLKRQTLNFLFLFPYFRLFSTFSKNPFSPGFFFSFLNQQTNTCFGFTSCFRDGCCFTRMVNVRSFVISKT